MLFNAFKIHGVICIWTKSTGTHCEQKMPYYLPFQENTTFSKWKSQNQNLHLHQWFVVVIQSLGVGVKHIRKWCINYSNAVRVEFTLHLARPHSKEKLYYFPGSIQSPVALVWAKNMPAPPSPCDTFWDKCWHQNAIWHKFVTHPV